MKEIKNAHSDIFYLRMIIRNVLNVIFLIVMNAKELKIMYIVINVIQNILFQMIAQIN